MIKIAKKSDSFILAELAVQIWCNHTIDELEKDFYETLSDTKSVFFIKFLDNVPIGFAQCALRTDYVEGTNSSPVGYLEGIFIKESYRKKGYAKELLLTCEKWAKGMGCIEFASDCEINNLESFNFHLAMGFIETNRIICFTKKI